MVECTDFTSVTCWDELPALVEIETSDIEVYFPLSDVAVDWTTEGTSSIWNPSQLFLRFFSGYVAQLGLLWKECWLNENVKVINWWCMYIFNCVSFITGLFCRVCCLV